MSVAGKTSAAAAALVELREKQRRVRNLCVIAHVDHGKTTLCDSLLARAQLISSRNAGDVRELDCDEQEMARGITINSTGVTLSYPDWQLRCVENTAEEEAASQAATTDNGVLYFGNLPWAAKPAAASADDASPDEAEHAAGLKRDIEAYVASLGAGATVIMLSKRGHAQVRLAAPVTPQLLAAVRAHPLVLGGRSVLVEEARSGPVSRLVDLCGAPSFAVEGTTVTLTVPPRDKDGEALVLSATAAAGEAIKAVKRRLAEQALPTVLGPTPTAATPAVSAEPGMTVNLIDSPGHVDFSGEVSAALRLCDGAILVVDPFDSQSKHQLCVQTEAVLRQALKEGVRPILFLNKIDKGIMSLQLEPEELYQYLAATINTINDVIETYQPVGLDFAVDPVQGTVLFGSGLQGWGFSLEQLAAMMAKKSGADPKKIARRLWGERYYDPATRKWGGQATGNGRGFVSHVLRPVYALFRAGMEGEAEELAHLAGKVGVAFRAAQRASLEPLALLRVALKGWLPCSEALLAAVDLHVPSPVAAQPYRVPLLYEGPMGDASARAMLACDPRAEAPLMVYISKLVVPPKGKGKGLLAFGRVLSGRLEAGQRVRILGPDFDPARSAKHDCFEGQARGLVCMMVDRHAPLHEARAGSLVAIHGIDKYIGKSATLATAPDAHRLRLMRFVCAPICRVAVEPARGKAPGDLQRLQAAFRTLAKSDPTIQCFVDEETGENIMAGAGELHLEVRLKTLAQMAGVEVRASEPVVKYCETATAAGPPCLGKSTNKHNRLYVTAEPLDEGTTAALESGALHAGLDPAARKELLAANGWARDAAKRVVGLEANCVLINATTGIDITPILDLVLNAFREVGARGPLARETLRGVRFSITDCKLHPDSVHRRADQIVPMARRAFNAALLAATPSLLEPVFQVDVAVDTAYLRGTCSVLKKRRGEIVSDLVVEGSTVHQVQAHVPVAAAFGFNGDLRGETSGHAFPVCSFSHWQALAGDPLEESTLAFGVAVGIRKHKGLPPAMPKLADFLDRL